ncbi:MAG: hypothetical protein AW10_00886 [Candidatus Accumulibacter appositus]|uniref:Uncharacterized protein n=1 Tax=Candidatus Accumulibacter appositus TaxID=1454003 RepID=A0A011P2X1_9PROT|nr:MAG: hypothetical protein AW10_00886 [Candidatus Accumulibacter appositus]
MQSEDRHASAGRHLDPAAKEARFTPLTVSKRHARTQMTEMSFR